MTPTVPGSTAVALATVGLSCLLSGAALLLVRRAVLSGALLATAGLVGLAGAVLTGTGATMLSWTALVGAWALLLPLALTTYPRHRWRHPVDLVALCVVLGSGVLVVVQPTDSRRSDRSASFSSRRWCSTPGGASSAPTGTSAAPCSGWRWR